MTDPLPFPLEGSTLILGPSNVGKTRMTAAALDRWLDIHTTAGVVVLEFGPEYTHEGRILGRRLDHFTTIPDAAWHGVVDAHAPRAEGASERETVALAAENARRAASILDSAPDDPTAVFVNDATIPFQHEAGDPARLTGYCDRADCAVLNAFESDELGTDDPVSTAERATLAIFREWADRVVELSGV